MRRWSSYFKRKDKIHLLTSSAKSGLCSSPCSSIVRLVAPNLQKRDLSSSPKKANFHPFLKGNKPFNLIHTGSIFTQSTFIPLVLLFTLLIFALFQYLCWNFKAQNCVPLHRATSRGFWKTSKNVNQKFWEFWEEVLKLTEHNQQWSRTLRRQLSQ